MPCASFGPVRHIECLVLFQIPVLAENQFGPHFRNFFVALYFAEDSNINAVLRVKYTLVDNDIGHSPFTVSNIWIANQRWPCVSRRLPR